jgi:hypothetical protein
MAAIKHGINPKLNWGSPFRSGTNLVLAGDLKSGAAQIPLTLLPFIFVEKVLFCCISSFRDSYGSRKNNFIPLKRDSDLGCIWPI